MRKELFSYDKGANPVVLPEKILGTVFVRD